MPRHLRLAAVACLSVGLLGCGGSAGQTSAPSVLPGPTASAAEQSCSGYPDRIKYGPQKATLVSIVVFGTAKSTDSTNYRQIDNGYLVLPDAAKVGSTPAMSLSLTLKAVLPNEATCFAVTPPLAGSYTLKMHEYRSNATGSLVLPLQ